MKTNSTTTNKTQTFLPSKIFATVLISCFLTVANTSRAFNPPAVGLKSNITGSGLGTNISLITDFKIGQANISIGPNFQPRKMNLSGFQCGYAHTVGKNTQTKLSVFLFGNIAYNFSAYFGNSAIRMEQLMCPEVLTDYSNVKLSTIEFHSGFGLKINHSKQVSTSWGVGAGVYNTLNNKELLKQMYREKCAASLSLSVTLAYKFKKN